MSNVAMEEPHLELRSLGRGILDTFKVLAEKPWDANKDSNIPSKRRVSAEGERFGLWARSLGLNQAGHASLDYRVRDASVIRASLADLLTELKDHLENLAAIILGDRLPLERDIEARRQSEAAPSVTASSDDETSLSSLSSAGSFQETEFRLASVTTRLDSLYKLAARIRNPRSRPQRPTKDLYKHVPESQREEYIKNQEQIEVSLVAYVQRQQLLECVTDEQLQKLGFSQEQLLQEHAAATHWLVRRTGIANARRKQQFVYWRKHAKLLGRDTTEVPLPVILKEPAEAVVQPQAPTTNAGKPVPSVSMATSATRIDLKMPGLDDMKSVISSRSRVSTTVSPKGEDLAWPPPPSHLAGSKYFSCPYCGTLCPAKIHQIHDLQPYHCTYEDCTDPNRLYGLRQEWIDHENQHRRVWHCHIHEEEFETQPDYMRHLHDKWLEHRPEDSSTEMVAAVVGASSKPHRDCPFCPTAFSDVATMQRHVRYHLERIALYALPDIAEEEAGELASGQPSDSHQVLENRGRHDSVTYDFTEQEQQSFLEIAIHGVDDAEEPRQSKVTAEDIQEFAAGLELLQVPTAMSDNEFIMEWIPMAAADPQDIFDHESLPFILTVNVLPADARPQQARCVLDTGLLQGNIVSLDFAHRLGYSQFEELRPSEQSRSPNAAGDILIPIGAIYLTWHANLSTVIFRNMRFLVVDGAICDLVIGAKSIAKHQIITRAGRPGPTDEGNSDARWKEPASTWQKIRNMFATKRM